VLLPFSSVMVFTISKNLQWKLTSITHILNTHAPWFILSGKYCM
jgi:hypothetical protein